jgi:uncharacterized protein (TIGR00303 family)
LRILFSDIFKLEERRFMYKMVMRFLSKLPDIAFTKPLFCSILGNTLLSTVPGISGAGPNPEGTLLTPVLDAELVTRGYISSFSVKPNTPTGCPTPASITRAMMELSGVRPLFINAGLHHRPTVPCFDVYGDVGSDPRYGEAVPRANELFTRGEMMGEILSDYSDLLVLGECVPGGTTTALCVLRALGYNAAVSSSFATNPVNQKEEICRLVLGRIHDAGLTNPLDIIRYAGDPMMPVAAGIAKSYAGSLLFAGGTQMLAVCAIVQAMRHSLSPVVTTAYVRDDPSANVQALANEIGADMIYVDPGFGDLGHSGLARYCIGEVKEGMGAGGAMCLAHLTGHSAEEIRNKILTSVSAYN